MAAKDIREVIFLDVETTALEGPESRRDAIIEIAAARVDIYERRIVDSYDTLIFPHGQQVLGPAAGVREDRSLTWNLGEYHVKAGHFAGVDWAAQDGTVNDYGRALGVLGTRFLIPGATIAGQNPRFDLDHLKRDWDLYSDTWPRLDYHVIDLCVPSLYLVMAGKIDGVSLRHAVPWAWAEPNRVQEHRAGPDVRDAIRVFFAQFDYFTAGIRPEPNIHWEAL